MNKLNRAKQQNNNTCRTLIRACFSVSRFTTAGHRLDNGALEILSTQHMAWPLKGDRVRSTMKSKIVLCNVLPRVFASLRLDIFHNGAILAQISKRNHPSHSLAIC